MQYETVGWNHRWDLAQRIYPGETLRGTMDDSSDVDFYVVSFDTSGMGKFELDPSYTQLDVDLEVFEVSSGSLVSLGRSTRGAGSTETLILNVSANKNYYICVTYYGNQQPTGNIYELKTDIWYNYNDYRPTLAWNGRSSNYNFGHLANDFGKNNTTDIKAIYEGTVVFAEYTRWNGNVIHIRHNLGGKTFYSFYAHLSEMTVRSGNVEAGQKIGVMGGTGNDGNGFTPHLHLGIYLGQVGEGDTPGYFKINGVKTYFDSDAHLGYKNYSSKRFFDPQKVFKTGGQIILDNYINM